MGSDSRGLKTLTKNIIKLFYDNMEEEFTLDNICITLGKSSLPPHPTKTAVN